MKALTKLFLLLLLSGLFPPVPFVIDSVKADPKLENLPSDTGKARFFLKLAGDYANLDPDTALYFASKALRISDSLKWNDGRSIALNKMGTIHLGQADYSLALEKWERLLSIQESIDSPRGISIALNNLGLVHQEIGNLPKSLDYFQRAMKIRRSIGDTSGLAQSYNNIGMIYQDMDDHEAAIQKFMSSVKMKKRLGDSLKLANSYNNLGISYKNLGDLNKAHKYYQKSLKINRELDNRQGISSDLLNIGEFLESQGQYYKALEHFQQSLKTDRLMGDKEGVAKALGGIGRIYSRLENYDRAREYHLKVLDAAKKIGSYELLSRSHRELMGVYKNEGDQKRALHHHQLYTKYEDSLRSKQKVQSLQEMKVKYKVQKREKELAQQEAARKEAELQQSRTLWLAVSGLGGLLFLVFVLIWDRLRKRKARELLENQYRNISKEKKEKEVLLKEVHHRVKNNLQLVNSLLNLQSGQIEDGKVKKIFTESQKRVRSMALFHEKMTRDEENEELKFEDYLQQLLERLIDSYGMENIEFESNIKIRSGNLSKETLTSLGLITNELITNSLKYAFPEDKGGKIFISLDQLDSGVFRFQYQDNGIGLPDEVLEKPNQSLGMTIIASLTEQIEGTLNIVENEKGKGVEIRFQ